MSKPNFRAGVVIVVQRADGQVLAFERLDTAGAWQLPQGGIDNDETPIGAAWREMAEETGLNPESVELTREHPNWTVYAWPNGDARSDGGVALSGRLGQAHRWFFFAPLDETKIRPQPDGREFRAWRWMSVDDLIRGIVEFRRVPYEQVLRG